MDNQKLLKLNRFILDSYECLSFTEFLKAAIMQLHELTAYDSGLFFCAISRDCSFFKPYTGGSVDCHYGKQRFPDREEYLKLKEENDAGSESRVYKALDFKQGIVAVDAEPRSSFLASQENYYIACVRIVYRGQFLGEIYLHRSKDKPDFDEEDMFILRLLQPHISNVFHIIHSMAAVSFFETDSGRLAKIGLCMLDSELSLAGGNVTGYEMLKTPTVFGSSILYHLKELCEDMQSDLKNDSPMLLRNCIFKTAGGNLRVSVVLYTHGTNKKDEHFLIEMEQENSEQLLSDYKFKFTKRETDIIDGIIQGKNNLQLASSLNLSENTIKTHIQSIYRKVGANNRTELTYILMTNHG